MHELSLAQGIVEAVERTAVRAGLSRVCVVRVAVGELAGVDVGALRFAWRSVSATPLLAGAGLEVESPSGEAWCIDCARTVPLHRFDDACPRCGGGRLLVTGGRDLKVIDLEGI